LLGLAGVYFVVYRLGGFADARRDRPFAREAWLQADLRTRGTMVDDLIQRRLLEGKTRAQVEELLGAPDRASELKVEYDVDIGHTFVSGPWLYDLRVKFDPETHRVTEVLVSDD